MAHGTSIFPPPQKKNEQGQTLLMNQDGGCQLGVCYYRTASSGQITASASACLCFFQSESCLVIPHMQQIQPKPPTNNSFGDFYLEFLILSKKEINDTNFIPAVSLGHLVLLGRETLLACESRLILNPRIATKPTHPPNSIQTISLDLLLLSVEGKYCLLKGSWL